MRKCCFETDPFELLWMLPAVVLMIAGIFVVGSVVYRAATLDHEVTHPQKTNETSDDDGGMLFLPSPMGDGTMTPIPF